MNKLIVVSMRGGQNKPDGKTIIQIDRKTIFGNPCERNKPCVVCGEKHSTNTALVACYRVYLWNRMNTDKYFMARLFELAFSRDVKALACWCKPNACHGDVLVNAIEYIRKYPEQKYALGTF